MSEKVEVLISELRKDIKKYSSKSDGDLKDLSKKVDDSFSSLKLEMQTSFKALDSQIHDVLKSCNGKVSHDDCNLNIREHKISYDRLELRFDKDVTGLKTILSDLSERISELETTKDEQDGFLKEIARTYKSQSRESTKSDYDDHMFL
jgi:hypothetical protein